MLQHTLLYSPRHTTTWGQLTKHTRCSFIYGFWVFILPGLGTSLSLRFSTGSKQTNYNFTRIFCHPCAPGRQHWLSQQITPSASMWAWSCLTPREDLGTTLPWRVTCCALGLLWVKELQACNFHFHLSIKPIFMWASTFVNTLWWRSIYSAGSVWCSLEVTHLVARGILRPQLKFFINLTVFSFFKWSF